MDRPLRRLLLGALVLGGCAGQQPQQHAQLKPQPRRLCLLAGPMQPTPGQVAPPGRSVCVSTTDCLGEPVRLGGAEQKGVTIVYFMSRESKDESADLARGVDERLLEAPIDQVGIVDVHKFGGVTKPVASYQLRKSAGEGRDRRRKRREEHHVDASDALVKRWHLIGDFDGALLKHFGVEQNIQHPLAFVVEPDGRLHGPYHDVASVVNEVERLGASRSSNTARRELRSPASSLRSASR
jgi:hypothetical protein